MGQRAPQRTQPKFSPVRRLTAPEDVFAEGVFDEAPHDQTKIRQQVAEFFDGGPLLRIGARAQRRDGVRRARGPNFDPRINEVVLSR